MKSELLFNLLNEVRLTHSHRTRGVQRYFNVKHYLLKFWTVLSWGPKQAGKYLNVKKSLLANWVENLSSLKDVTLNLFTCVREIFLFWIDHQCQSFPWSVSYSSLLNNLHRPSYFHLPLFQLDSKFTAPSLAASRSMWVSTKSTHTYYLYVVLTHIR